MKFKPSYLLLVLLVTYFVAFLVSCGGDDPDPGPTEITVPSASNVVITDVRDNGDASDISISFTKASDETHIKEYWIVLIKAFKASNLSIEQALALAQGNYQVVTPTNINQSLFLDEGLKDSDGDDISDDQEYAARVISVATDAEETISSISTASNEITVGVFDITISYIGNMGVVISDGSKQVIIDGVHGNLGGWYQADPADLNALINGSGRWGQSDILMTTHNHGDHYSPSSTTTFLTRNTSALYIGPPGARPNSSGRVAQVSPSRGNSETVVHNDIEVEVLNIRHFDQFGNNFSAVQNYAYIVNIGGKKVMHIGDGFYSNENFAPFNLAGKGIDVLVIPTFNTLISAASRDVIMSQINPKNIIAAHLQTSTSLAAVRAQYPTATIFTEQGATARY